LVSPDQPTIAAPLCPKCGSPVLPGEAFCDNCGADLTAAPIPVAAPVAADAPTMLAAPPVAPAQPAPAGADVRCPACGQLNLPGEAFCDNCGASLTAAAPAPAPSPPTSPDDATILAPPLAAPEAPITPPAPEAPEVLPNDPTMIAGVPATSPAPTPDPQPAPEPTPEPAPAPEPAPEPEPAAPAEPAAPEPATPAPPPGPDPARRAELEAEIGRQQQIIAQFEQMQAMFGATTPPAVTAGLDEARVALAKAEADLAALAPPAPPVDPEAVRQLEAEIGRQQQIIAQFEQMQAMFGAAAPPAVIAGLSEARVALAKAEADLTALTGGVPAARPAPPATAADPLATIPAPGPAPTSAPPAPRLIVTEGGQALNLPTDKAEIIIGR